MTEIFAFILAVAIATTFTWRFSRVIKADGYGHRPPPAKLGRSA